MPDSCVHNSTEERVRDSDAERRGVRCFDGLDVSTTRVIITISYNNYFIILERRVRDRPAERRATRVRRCAVSRDVPGPGRSNGFPCGEDRRLTFDISPRVFYRYFDSVVFEERISNYDVINKKGLAEIERNRCSRGGDSFSVRRKSTRVRFTVGYHDLYFGKNQNRFRTVYLHDSRFLLFSYLIRDHFSSAAPLFPF